MKNRLLTIILTSALLGSCGGKKEKKEEQLTRTQFEATTNYVDTIRLKKRTFSRQIICNGKLRALVKTDLSFVIPGIISKVNVMNGSQVQKGDLLAIVDTEEARIELGKARGQMEKAEIDLADKLIGQGYDADTTRIPEAIMKSARITSGYNNVRELLEAAQRRVRNCHLYAPFGGRLANIDSKVYQRSSDRFCTLIDDSRFDVEFTLLEAELGEVAVGQQTLITPFIDEERQFPGKVTQVNPVIDDNGQVKIRAEVANRDGFLVEGMNVKVVIENAIKNQFVVPKEAVVVRDGYFVVFRLVDGAAVWTYVDVPMSNMDSHVITGCARKQTTLSGNDIIITSGNLNLADGTAVTPK